MSIIEALDLENETYAYIIEYSPESETPDNYAIFFSGNIYPNKTKLNLKTESHLNFKNYLIFINGEEDTKNYVILNLQGKIVSNFNDVNEAGYCSFDDEKLLAFYTIKKTGDEKFKLEYYTYNFNKAKSYVIKTDDSDFESKSGSKQSNSDFSYYIDNDEITHMKFESE